ncbi:MFS transporter [Sporolactobacillus sp. THM19-2]|uniref:MFS transporter n=1 Tax=Sporolactobacillus sp. THM19-2 TaxID=2511171 RepID=UPI00102279F4|nr:MFS transporter [Sporolactobacillus sp. THM19-2]RYL92242.1 MFS transporter [Sporolactobacillus sp. THM19-2]
MTKNHAFRYLWMGQSLANCGDVFYVVGLMTVIYADTGSAFLMALVPFVNTLSRFTGDLTAPLMIESAGVKRTLVVSQAGKTLLLLFFAVLSSLDIKDALWVIFLFVAIISFLDGWATPSRNAMIPNLVVPEKLVRANSFLSMLDQCINMSSWAVGGVFAAWLGGSSMIWLTGILFALSTGSLAMISYTDDRVRRKPMSGESPWQTVRDGWIMLWRTPVLRVIAIIDGMESLAFVVWIAAIIYVYVQEVLHVGAAFWGYINFSFFAGLLISGAAGLRWSSFIQDNLKQAALAGLFITGLVTLWFGCNTYPWLALFLSLLVGMANQMKEISFQTLIQTNTKKEKMGKIYAALDAIVSVMFGSGTVLIGFLADQLGVRFVFILSAVLSFLTFFIFLIHTRSEKPERFSR